MNETKLLYSLQDIADIHDCSVRHAKDIVSLPGFPREVRTSTPKRRRWLAQEVHKFLTEPVET